MGRPIIKSVCPFPLVLTDLPCLGIRDSYFNKHATMGNVHYRRIVFSIYLLNKSGMYPPFISPEPKGVMAGLWVAHPFLINIYDCIRIIKTEFCARISGTIIIVQPLGCPPQSKWGQPFII
jgi:hypothetical protein